MFAEISWRAFTRHFIRPAHPAAIEVPGFSTDARTGIKFRSPDF